MNFFLHLPFDEYYRYYLFLNGASLYFVVFKIIVKEFCKIRNQDDMKDCWLQPQT